MNLSPLHTEIQRLLSKQANILIGIDGPCASGKSTLAQTLGEYYKAPVIHIDDFFLPPEFQTPEQLSQLGGNIDSQRFLGEILHPLSQQKAIKFRPWRCKSGDFGDEFEIAPAPLVLIEGAYSMRPDFREFYHLRIYLTAPLPLRLERIRARNGEEGLEMFQSKWIPLENRYFQGCSVADCCEIHLSF